MGRLGIREEGVLLVVEDACMIGDGDMWQAFWHSVYSFIPPRWTVIDGE